MEEEDNINGIHGGDIASEDLYLTTTDNVIRWDRLQYEAVTTTFESSVSNTIEEHNARMDRIEAKLDKIINMLDYRIDSKSLDILDELTEDDPK